MNGTCNCTAGYRGLTCNDVCAYGTYGDRCEETCDCNGSPCHHVTGECMCGSGYKGSNCNESELFVSGCICNKEG